MVHVISESTLIGREKELKELLDDLNHDKSIRLVTGELFAFAIMLQVIYSYSFTLNRRV